MPDHDRALAELYSDFDKASLQPLWTLREELMPERPTPRAVATCWRWSTLMPLAERAGEIVPVGRGGERRAIALSNPGLGGRPFATPTLWAAIQYLGAHEQAPAHRHSQAAFRFVVDGEGVFTNVDGDAIAMRRGDLLLTASWRWHEHHNPTDRPMAWLDGLDVPLALALDATFFEYGPDVLATAATPVRSRSEELFGHPGLRPVGAAVPPSAGSPLVAYRFAHTDAALTAQLELAAAGACELIEPAHAAVRYVDPTTGRDALSTMRTEMHRLAPGGAIASRRAVGSAVWQIFDGSGSAQLGDEALEVAAGDLLAVPADSVFGLSSVDGLDAFCFSDAPVLEALGLLPPTGG